MVSTGQRVAFLDYLRVFACLMVMFVHACEQFYFGPDGGLFFGSRGDAFWVTAVDSACRAAVPLFVMASSYLLFPLTKPTGEFFRRRFMRVFVPFAFWCAVYLWRFGGDPACCLFNFPMATGGHLWFVPMLLGLYLLMPLLSPWAEKAGEREVRGWLLVWLFTTTFPFLRKLCGCLCGAPAFGSVPYLYGECPWNAFGTFQYVSGFFGYLLLGLYFRRFVPELSWRKTLSIAVPLWLVGYGIVAVLFFSRIPGGGAFPVSGPYSAAVDLEMSWEFCGTGVALTTLGYFLVLRRCAWGGWLHAKVMRPLSEVSYGTYLMHILVLVVLAERMKGALPTPLAIATIAVGSFAVSSLAGLAVRRIPFVGKLVLFPAVLFMGAGTLSAETLDNGSIRFEFTDAARGFALERIVNRVAGDTVFAERNDPKGFLWMLSFGRADDVKARETLTNLMKCRARRMLRNPDGGATFVWEGMDLPDDPGVVTVRTTVRFAADGSSRWSIEVQNQSRDWGLLDTQYPVLRHMAKDGEADFLCPERDVGARLLRRRRWGGRPISFWSMGYAPMMAAWMIGDAGCYVAAHDSEMRIKQLLVSPEADCRFVTPVENAGLPGKAASGPRYEVTVAAFKGDWWQAAGLYRAWALTTKWTAKGRMVDRADYPKRLCDIPLWLNIHGKPAEVSNVMCRVRALFPNVRAGIHWHGWQHSGHDINYPEYFPEQPGTKECVAYLKAIGEEALPYTNGRLWTRTSYGFDYARPCALTRRDGCAYEERYGKTPPFSPMCPFTRQWCDTVNRFAGDVLDLGFGAIFLDQLGAVGGQACYAADHAHPLGGGDWYFAGYQKLLERVHRAYCAKDAFLTTEGSGEAWMNVIDGYLTVMFRNPEMVPFLHAVYNGYTTWFCSPENHEDDTDSFWAGQARETMWGQLLGWYHPAILDCPEKVALVRRLVEFRQANVDCLSFGEMLDEVRFAGNVPRQKVEWLGRKQFYDWKVAKAPRTPTVSGELPGAMGYVWKSGTTGKTCAIVANLTNLPLPVEFAWGGRTERLTLAPRDLRRFDE